ncbi:TM0106 family RecB-like putative nuclease [Corynebacterium uterequi]|uniref:TM0106 family RecB-like putative nuclease n=1 Tax=Corynebacterium uterequi TaxID=1072256 RepID=UPI001F28FD0A|nr:TM0106 family RecB-like putative nuclease [Corynebacterium uterequi]
MTAFDLIGCRYRYVQRLAHPDQPYRPEDEARRARRDAARAAILSEVPRRRGLGDGRGRAFRRVRVIDAPDAPDPETQTQRAMDRGAHVITDAVFSGVAHGQRWRVDVDILVRAGDGRYVPVIISSHRVARRDEAASTLAVAVSRLGLSEPMAVSYRLRHHVADGYRLALAARGLGERHHGGLGGAVGQDSRLAFFEPTAPLDAPLDRALQRGWASQPRRLKECSSCRFWSLCETELVAADDISLVLPGDRGAGLRERGITTVTQLINADAGEPTALARAWSQGVALLARVPEVTGPRADVEIDVDMEAYLDHGAYLWGAFDGADYHPFVTWQALGKRAEGENFAAFWSWLMQRKAEALAGGKSFAAYCYSAHGENHWLRQSALRFYGKIPGVPSPEEVARFIASEHWVDVFAFVKAQLLGPEGIGLKVVGRAAGYTWADADIDGEESLNTRRIAVGSGAPAERARASLLRYNADDTRATAAVRHWLRAGAPGIARLDGVPAPANNAG